MSSTFFHGAARRQLACIARCRALSLLCVLLAVACPAQAEPTPLRIMVRADDAKFIGSGVGGINISVRDADSGELLGGGLLRGGTGDTAALMETPQIRGNTIAGDGDADLRLSLDLERPRRIEVSATGPLGSPQSQQWVRTSLWLLPGQDRVSAPLVLHLNGLIVDLLEHRVEGRQITLKTHVAMLCGCGVTPAGLWRADDFTVTVQLRSESGAIAEANLSHAGEPSLFAGAIAAPAAGDLELLLQAVQHSTGNAGVYRMPLRILP